MEIKKYSNKNFDEWDEFVLNNSANGTIFHTQKFLSYHPKDRFDDQSIMLYEKNKLVCVIPCARIGDRFFSHPGTSAGGPVILKKYFKLKYIIEIIDLMLDYYDNKLDFRLVESYFVDNSNEAILYCILHKMNVLPEISTYKKTDFGDKFFSISQNRTRSAVRKLEREGFFTEIASLSEYELFYNLLEKNLVKFETKPVHSFSEILNLVDILSNDQLLFLLKDKNGKICACSWVIKATQDVWHTQYIVKNYDRIENGLVELLLINIADYANQNNVNILSLGISTENKGRLLNQNLISFKEHLGIRYQNRYLVESV